MKFSSDETGIENNKENYFRLRKKKQVEMFEWHLH